MRRRRRRLAAAIGALAVLLAACGDAGDTNDGVRASSGVATTTSTTEAPAPTTSSTTAAPGRTTTSTTARTTTSTTRAGAPTSTTVAVPRVLTPAVPGVYRYDTTGGTTFAGTSTPFPAVTGLVVGAPSGTQQKSTRDLRDGAGNGLATEITLDYRPEGAFLAALRLTVGFSGASDTRDLRPTSAVLLLATGAGPGAHREADLVGATSTAKLVVDVLREEKVTVAGKAIDTLVVRAQVTLAPGDVTGRQELTVNIDRSSRLWVKEHSVTDASAAGGLFTLHSEYTATIQRLTP